MWAARCVAQHQSLRKTVMLQTYRKLLDLLAARERKWFRILIGVMIIAAFAELLSLSVFLLLLGMLAEPQVIFEDATLSWAYTAFGFSSVFSFQLAASAVVALATFVGLAIKAGSAYAIIKFTTHCGHHISTRLMAAYLNQDYSWSLDRNTAELAKNILQDSDAIARQVAIPALRVLANAILAASITGFLIYLDPLIALGALAMIGGGYAGIYALVRTKLRNLGDGIVQYNIERFRLTNEVTNGLKEVKLAGLEQSYSARFHIPSMNRVRHVVTVQTLSETPRYVLEGLTFVVLLGTVLTLLVRNDGSIAAAVPTLGIFVFSIMRLLPALQQVYYGFASVRIGQALVDLIHTDYMKVTVKPLLEGITDRDTKLIMNTALRFDEVGYTYPAANRAALKGLSAKIEANTTIGIVGGTGAGKTTFIDLVLGLLKPEAGRISVDGVTLDDSNLRHWQNAIGYVPQQIYLTDDTVAANIAFGVAPEDRDLDKIKQAAKVAALHEFIDTELPEKYDTAVGERGVRLSGGQRQRIGIARALYHEPAMLILDEATSALDTITESIVMEAVQNLRGQKTIILIAHRLSTVRNCDSIFLMEHGKITATGTYDMLAKSNKTFEKMVRAGDQHTEHTPPHTTD